MEQGDSTTNASIFPQDIRLEDIREAIKGRTDFRECQYEDHCIFVYFLGMAKDIFPDPNTAPDPYTKFMYQLRRECRGIVFSLETGKVIARRFHKFFNVNETEETKVTNIDLNRPYVVTEKMDGSMISPYYTLGQLKFGTKNGVKTDTALSAEEYIDSIKDKIDYRGFSATWIEKGWTPIFEFCSPKRKIVLKYSEESLNLITLRNISTGLYYPYDEMLTIAKHFDIPVVKSRSVEQLGIDLQNASKQNFEEFYQKIQKATEVEGFVIRFDDGNMLKIKTHWYFGINKSLDVVKNAGERFKWSCIIKEQYDDLRPHLSESERQNMDIFAKKLIKEIELCAQRILEKVMRDHANTDRKSFVQVVNNARKAERGLLWKAWAEIENQKDHPTSHENLLSVMEEHVTNQIKESLGSGQRLEEARVLLNNLKYEELVKEENQNIVYDSE